MCKVASLLLSSSISGDDLGSGCSACSYPLWLKLRGLVIFLLHRVTPLGPSLLPVYLQRNSTSCERHPCFLCCHLLVLKPGVCLSPTENSAPWAFQNLGQVGFHLSALTFPPRPEIRKGIVIRSDVIIHQWLFYPHPRALALSSRLRVLSGLEGKVLSSLSEKIWADLRFSSYTLPSYLREVVGIWAQVERVEQ